MRKQGWEEAREGAKGVWGKGPYSRGHSKVQGPRGTGLCEELEEDPCGSAGEE